MHFNGDTTVTASTAQDIHRKLSEPFSADGIEWRVSHTSKDETKALVLPYLTARAVMDRLDEVVGPDGWQVELTRIDKGFMCRLSVRMGSSWVARMDVSDESDIEALKGAASGSLKRAAVHFGVGRYLYGSPQVWVDLYTTADRRHATSSKYHKSQRRGQLYWTAPGDPSTAVSADPPGPDAPEAAVQAMAPRKVASARPAAQAPTLTDGTFHGIAINAPCQGYDCANLWPCVDHPVCPTCSSQMWDNRLFADGGKGKQEKRNPRAPDFKCKSKDGCDGAFWPGDWQAQVKDNAMPGMTADAAAGPVNDDGVGDFGFDEVPF